VSWVAYARPESYEIGDESQIAADGRDTNLYRWLKNGVMVQMLGALRKGSEHARGDATVSRVALLVREVIYEHQDLNVSLK